MAEILGEDVDEWTALAGRLSEDLPEIIHEEPKGVPDLLRAVRGMTADQLRKLCDEAERMKKEGKDEEPGGAKNFCRLHCPLRAVLSSVAIQIRPDTANKAKPPAVTIARRGGVRREN